MRIFRDPNPNSRRPACLQTNTKQNLVLNVVLAGAFIAASVLNEKYWDRKFKEKYDHLYPEKI